MRIRPPSPTDFRLIVVPSELIHEPVHLVKELNDGENIYKVEGNIAINKEDPWPGGLLLLATGMKVSKKQCFEIYKKSDTLYLFIVKQNGSV